MQEPDYGEAPQATPGRRRPKWLELAFVALAVLATLVNWGLARTPGLYLVLAATMVAVYLAIIGTCWRQAELIPRWWQTKRGLLLAALLLRLPSIAAEPCFSDDVYRYLWEGKVQRAGFSPYAYAPDAPELVHLREPWFEQINHPDVSAAYPPVAQLLFRIVPANLQIWKVACLVAELLLIVLVTQHVRQRRQPLWWTIVYGFHPLALTEITGSAHFDVFALLFLLLALRFLGRSMVIVAAVMTGLGAMIKPLALAPAAAMFGQGRWLSLLVLALVMGATLLPFAGDGTNLLRGVEQYADHWEFQGFLFPWLRATLEHSKQVLESSSWQHLREWGYRIQPSGHSRELLRWTFVGVAFVLAYRRRHQPARLCLALLIAFLLTATTVYPWYVLWCVPFLPFAPCPVALTLTMTALVSHYVPVTAQASGSWVEPGWLWFAHWLPPGIVAAWLRWSGSSKES